MKKDPLHSLVKEILEEPFVTRVVAVSRGQKIVNAYLEHGDCEGESLAQEFIDDCLQLGLVEPGELCLRSLAIALIRPAGPHTTIQASIVAADADTLDVKLRCKTHDDFNKLVRSGAFFRIIDFEFETDPIPNVVVPTKKDPT